VKNNLGIDLDEITIACVGFVVVAILVPLVMAQLVSTSVLGWSPAVVTIWQVLLPVIYLISTGIYFIPKIGGKDKED
jgi:hypothetical protein